MRIMGLDIGERRIGVAVSDELGITAQGIEVIILENDISVFTQLKELIDTYQIKEIIVGLPKELSGKIGYQADKTLKFVANLESNLNIPIKTWDERLSTKIAKSILKEAPLKRKKEKAIIDKLSAVIILQNYLDYCNKDKKNGGR